MNYNYWICVIVPFLLITLMAFISVEIALGMIASLVGINNYYNRFVSQRRGTKPQEVRK